MLERTETPPEPNLSDPDYLIALKVLMEYATKKERFYRDCMIDLAVSTASQDSYGDSEYANKIEKSTREYNKIIANGSLIKHIISLKQYNQSQQRQELYKTLNVSEGYSFGDQVTHHRAIEILLEKLPMIDANKIEFDRLTLRFVSYHSDTNRTLSSRSQLASTSTPLSVTNNNFSQFNSKRSNEHQDVNSIKIDVLNITIAEFNQTYKGQYAIVTGEGVALNGFWLLMDNNNQQWGVLTLKNGELHETQHSKGTNNCLNTIKRVYAPH